MKDQAQSEITRQKLREAVLRNEISRLKRLLGDKMLEVDFFKAALQKIEARRQNSAISGGQASTMPSGTQLPGSLSVEHKCRLAQVRRAGFYRHLHGQAPNEESMIVRSAIPIFERQHKS